MEIYLKQHKSHTVRARELQFGEKYSPITMCHLSRVKCHVSHVTSQVSRVTCHLSHVFLIFFYKKKFQLVEGLLSTRPTRLVLKSVLSNKLEKDIKKNHATKSCGQLLLLGWDICNHRCVTKLYFSVSARRSDLDGKRQLKLTLTLIVPLIIVYNIVFSSSWLHTDLLNISSNMR